MKQSVESWNQAFVVSTKPHWNAMLRFATTLCRSRENAEDLLQTALMKALKNFVRFAEDNFPGHDSESLSQHLVEAEGSRHLRNWLFKIMKNTWLDAQSSQKRWLFETAEGVLEGVADPQPSHPEMVNALVTASNLQEEEKAFYKAALDDNWTKKIGELSERQRSVLFLAADDYSYKEIAEVLGIPMGTVMSTLSRTLQKLKKT